MSDWALFWGVAAMLCAAYALLGSFLEWIWGVDPSRRTAGSMQSGGGIAFLMVLHVIACAAYGAGAGMQMEYLLGKTAALMVMLLVCAVVYPALGFSVLFASVRHEGEGLAGIADRLYGDVGKTLTQVVIVIASAVLANFPLYAIMHIGLLQTIALSQIVAPRIKNEAHIRIAAFSGMAASGMAACFALMFRVDIEQVWVIVLAVSLIGIVWMICVMMGAGVQALLNLTKGNGIQRKERIAEKLLATGCMFALWFACLYASYLFSFPLTVILGMMICLYAFFLCMAWMKHIGRGLFSRN